MSENKAVLMRLAEAVADGEPVDWNAESAGHNDLAPRLQGLRMVESISMGHRSLESTGETEDTMAGATSQMAATQGLPADDDSAPGRRWGPLELIEKLGEGAFGEVWRAREANLDREVALKLRKKRPAADDPFAGRFLEEARKLAKVDHENVVEVYGADEHEGRAGIWTKLVRGKTLEDELQERGSFGDREAALVGIELCRALAAVHGAGLVHRDVKTANAMRAEGGRILLMDFGSVTDIPVAGGGRESHGVSGTPLAMAPEALRGVPLEPSADIYSLGILLYRLTSGDYPVTAESLLELDRKHREKERVPLRDRRPDLSAKFINVVECALSPAPPDRYQSAGTMESALLKTMAGTVAAQEPASSPESVESPSRAQNGARSWWRGWLPASLAAAALAMGSLFIWQMLPPSAFDVDASIFRESREGEGGDIRLATGGHVRPDDRLFLEVEGDEEMHVYVINQDENGEEYLLFPLEGFETVNPLSAGVKHRLPGTLSGSEQSWVVTSAGGTEHFLLVASAEPVALLENQIRSMAHAEPGVPVRMDSGTAIRLRGVGGVDQASGTGGGAQRELDDLATSVSKAGNQASYVHVEMFELSNPASSDGS
jgi:serine/threonine protein kinase